MDNLVKVVGFYYIYEFYIRLAKFVLPTITKDKRDE